MRIREVLKDLAFVGALAAGVAICVHIGHGHAQSPPFVPDFAFGKTPGMIAVRGPTRWQAIPVGTAGQVLSSSGPGVVPGWITPSGTGNVQTDGNAAANAIPYFTNGTTLGYLAPGGAALDKVLGQSGATAGYLKRTGAGAYSIAAIPSSDIPAFSGNDCSSAAGSGAISCAGLLTQSHTFTVAQNFIGTLSVSNPSPTVPSGLVAEVNGSLLDFGVNYSQFGAVTSGQPQVFFRVDTRTGNDPFNWFYAAPGNAQNIVATMNGAGQFKPAVPMAVAYGGTGTASTGVALDNIAGFSGATNAYGNFISRNGVGVYGPSTVSQVLDNINNGSTVPQGSILYRDAGSVFASGQIWKVLPPGTSGQFLAANGAGANPSWASPSAPPAGARVLLNTITTTSGTTQTDTTSISGSYTEYDIFIEGLVPNANDKLVMQTQIGGSFATSYTCGVSGTSDAGSSSLYADASNPFGAIPITKIGGTTTVPSGSYGVNARINIPNPALTGRNQVHFDYNQAATDTQVTITYAAASGGCASPAGAITGFRFSWLGGAAFSAGKIKVYGSN